MLVSTQDLRHTLGSLRSQLRNTSMSSFWGYREEKEEKESGYVFTYSKTKTFIYIHDQLEYSFREGGE